MLNLPNVTLIAVATTNVEETVTALNKSLSGINYEEVKLLSHYRPDNLPNSIKYEEIDKFESIDDWNYFIFYNLYKYIDTDFALLIHYDGYVINPESWREEFLLYDYIGAPWIDRGIIGKDGTNIRVGNSVSLRSKRLLELPSKINIPWQRFEDNYNEDAQICIHNRNYFLDGGMNYAPLDVAKYFSHETFIPEIFNIKPFAFHRFCTPGILNINIDSSLEDFINIIPDTILKYEIEDKNELNQIINKAYNIGYRAYSLIEGIWGSKDSIQNINSNFLYIKKHLMTSDIRIFSLEDTYSAYINLDTRPDRNEHMVEELKKTSIKAERLRGKLPREIQEPEHKLAVMQNRTPGAIGCHYSQVEVMKRAFSLGKHALVMEDDLVFCSDLDKRLKRITEFLNSHEWDIFWLGGTYHIPAKWHNEEHTNPDLKNCTCTIGKDVVPTDFQEIVQTYGCWSTYAYIVNYNSIPKILELLDQNVFMSMGIDWLFIKLQPQLKTFAYVPGCVKQYDNQSNIGSGVTYFSTFSSLGDYWYQDSAENFDYENFYKKLEKC